MVGGTLRLGLGKVRLGELFTAIDSFNSPIGSPGVWVDECE